MSMHSPPQHLHQLRKREDVGAVPVLSVAAFCGLVLFSTFADAKPPTVTVQEQADLTVEVQVKAEQAPTFQVFAGSPTAEGDATFVIQLPKAKLKAETLTAPKGAMLMTSGMVQQGRRESTVQLGFITDVDYQAEVKGNVLVVQFRPLASASEVKTAFAQRAKAKAKKAEEVRLAALAQQQAEEERLRQEAFERQRKEEQRKAAEALLKKQEEERRLAALQKKQAEEARKEAERVAAEKKRQEEARRLAEQKRKEEEARRLAEQKRKEEEARRLAEQKRKEEEARRVAELKRKEEEARRLAEQKRKEEEEARRLAEQKRKEEEARRLAEQKRKEEEARRLAEQKRKEEEARRLAAQKRKEEEARRLAEQKRKEEEARRLAEQKRKDEEARRLAAQKRKEEEARRLAEQKRKEEEALRVAQAEERRRQEEARRRQAQGNQRRIEVASVHRSPQHGFGGQAVDIGAMSKFVRTQGPRADESGFGGGDTYDERGRSALSLITVQRNTKKRSRVGITVEGGARYSIRRRSDDELVLTLFDTRAVNLQVRRILDARRLKTSVLRVLPHVEEDARHRVELVIETRKGAPTSVTEEEDTLWIHIG